LKIALLTIVLEIDMNKLLAGEQGIGKLSDLESDVSYKYFEPSSIAE
jgi:hypothetical protein